MNKKIDVIIIGGGIGGLMSAYQLMETNPLLNVVMLEKGLPLNRRVCPIITGKVDHCIHCKHCAIMEGMAGAGAFSDGKYIISTEYGGWLTDFMPAKEVMSNIEHADQILQKFGATAHRYQPDTDLKHLCLQYDLHMNLAQVKHLGTDANFQTMANLIESLKDRVDIRTESTVVDVDKETKTVMVDHKGEKYTLHAEHIIFAIGRAGSDFFAKWCVKNGIPLENNQVDIGVRVELPYDIWSHFSTKIYEPKIWYRSKKYGDITRMFCFNERGHVVIENTHGVQTVNGHAFKDEAKKTGNSNFALLSTIKFTTPFNEPIEYARHIARLANMISGGSVLVQRFGDLMQGRRSDHRRLNQSTTYPTLGAVPGDLSLCIPKRQLDNIVETLQALDKVAPGTANTDTLLYGIECKYYSARPKTTNFELDKCKGIYALGDGAGFTRSLSHAAAHGIIIADTIAKR
ncbi:MAG: FAD-dependent oxidoreductase [Firmicutes bacterium HGW-Firmicutes-19]|nr:MAG: FAD-dependent oxidoreductase [Firmicutes bacterium HGW-Firmicutes-19]